MVGPLRKITFFAASQTDIVESYRIECTPDNIRSIEYADLINAKGDMNSRMFPRYRIGTIDCS